MPTTRGEGHSPTATETPALKRYPAGAMLRVADIVRVGDRPGLLQIGERTWLGYVERGLIPQGVKIGRTRCWPIELIEKIAREGLSEAGPADTSSEPPKAEVAKVVGSAKKVVGLPARSRGASAAAA